MKMKKKGKRGSGSKLNPNHAVKKTKAVNEMPESDMRLRTVFEQSPFSVQIFSQSGRCVQVNKAWKEMWESNVKDVLNYNIFKDKQLRKMKMMPIIKKAFSGQTVKLPQTLYNPKKNKKRGRPRWTDGIIYPVKDKAGKTKEVVLIHQDITDRKESEARLIEAEKRYRSTLDSMLEGCQIIGFDWKYLYLNNALAKQGKSSKEKLLGHTMMEKYPGIEKTEIFKKLKLCMKSRIPQKSINEFIFPDGSKGWFEIKVEPVPEGILILSEDITEKKEAEDKYRNIIEATKDIIYSYSPDGKIKYVSPNIKNYGYSQKDIIGESITKFIHPKDKKIAVSNLKSTLKTGKNIVTTVRLRKKNGTYMPIEETSNTLLEKGKIVQIVGIIRDISDRVKIEEKLKESQEINKKIIDKLNIGFAINKIGNGMAVYMNDKFSEIYGWPKKELNDVNTFFERVYPEPAYRREIKSMVMSDIASGDPSRMSWTDIKITTKDGKHKVVSAYNISLKEQGLMISTVQDITKIKEAEQKIKSEKDFSENIIETAPTLIVGLDNEGKIVLFNKASEKKTGYEKSEVLGKSWFNLFLEDSVKKEVYSEFLKIGSMGTTDFHNQFENSIIIKNGEKRTVLWSNTIVTDPSGKIKTVLAIGQDITEEKKYQEDREKAARELEKRVAELEKFEKITIGREIRMIELKKQIKNLEEYIKKKEVGK